MDLSNSLLSLSTSCLYFSASSFSLASLEDSWGSVAFRERELILYLIVAKISGHQSAEQQDEGNCA